MRSLLKFGGPQTPPPVTFDLTTAIPPGFTYSRADTVSTYRDSNGKLQTASANSPRFDHDASGNKLGLRIEGQRVNLFTGYNMTPTVTTGFSTTGTATIGLAADAAALAAAGLDTVCTGNVYTASGGASGGTVVLPGTTGSTGNCSFSCWARITSGSSASLTYNGTSPGSATISGSAYARCKLENQTISSTSVQMVVSVPAGVTVLFILCQMEVGGNASSEIKTAGAAATRYNDSLVDTGITTRSYFRLKQGAIIVALTYDNINTSSTTMPFFLGAGGQNFTYCLGMGTIAGTTRRKTLSRYYVGSAQQYSPDIGSIDASGQRYAFATSWIDGSMATAASGADCFQTFSVGPLSGIDRLYLGGRATADFIFGHLLSLKVYKTYRTAQQLGKDMVQAGDYVIHTCGQSNMTDWFSAQSGSNNSGEVAAKAQTDPLWSTTRNWFANGGTFGTSVIYYPGVSSATNWWYDPSTGDLGVPFQRWAAMAAGCANGTYQAIIDTSGESDAGIHIVDCCCSSKREYTST